MKKILSFDLGVSSIGWAYVIEDNTQSSISKLGVRSLPIEQELVKNFTRGNSTSFTEDRTQRRGARRNLDRYQDRRKHLKILLKKYNMLPSSKVYSVEELYKLRSEAPNKKVELQELGRLLLLLNKKRGYKSNLKANKESDSDYLGKITERQNILKSQKITIGQYLYKQINDRKENEPKIPLKGQTFYRQDYINEFEAIWKEQSKHHKFLTDELKTKIKRDIIFYQRPLKSAKHLVANCKFEKNLKAALKSSPFFQYFRLLQNINNITLSSHGENREPLSDEQRYFLLEKLQSKGQVSNKQVLKWLGYTSTEYKLNFEKIEGNRTRASFLKIFEKIGYDNIGLLDFDVSDENFSNQSYFKLWHLIHSAEDEEILIKNLMKNPDFAFTYEEAKEVSKISLEKDYGSLSTKALRKIIPYLEQGLQYSEASEKVGYNHSELDVLKLKNGKLELLRTHSLRNPMVEKILNHLINLTNDIICDPDLGKPDEIRIELARELKKSAKERRGASKRISDNEKANKQARAKIRELYPHIKHISYKQIEKYKLAVECNWQSIYTGEVIPQNFLDSKEWDVEHIIPKALLFDDSFMNKTLCEAQFNRDKGKQTAFDYMKSLGENEYIAFEQRVKDLLKDPRHPKRKKLLMSKDDLPTDFIDRQLRISQYIAKKAVEILKPVCKDVLSTTGSVTSFLRQEWGLNDALKELNIKRYREKEQTYRDELGREQIRDWSKRDDHRHHAVDALVIAFTSNSIINYLNRLNSLEKPLELRKTTKKIAEPYVNFRKDALKALDDILISFNPKRKVGTKKINSYKIKGGYRKQKTLTPRGFFHKETIYGKIKRYAEKKTPLNGRFSAWEDIANELEQEVVENHLQKYDFDAKKAFAKKELVKNPLLLNDKPLTEVTLWETKFVIRKDLQDISKIEKIVDVGIRKKMQERIKEEGNLKKAQQSLSEKPLWKNKIKGIPVKRVRIMEGFENLTPLHMNEKGMLIDYVNLRNNHHVAIYKDDKGNLHEDVVSFWAAFERMKNHQPIVQYEHPDGYTFILSFLMNEMFVVGLNIEEVNLCDIKNNALISQHLYRVQKISNTNYMLRHHLATTIDHKTDEIHIRSLKKLKGLVKVKMDRMGNIKQYQLIE